MNIDEALERMARWEALRRRMAGRGRGEPVVEELIEALGVVLHRHGEVAVTVTIEGTAEPVTLRLHWRDGHLAVDAVPVPAPDPPATAPAEPTDTPEPTAALLAELIRQDPSVLRPRPVTD